MRKNWPLIGIAAFMAVFAIAAVACGGDDESEGTITSPAGEITIRIVSPEEGSSVRNPVVLQVEATGEVNIKEAAAGEEDSLHYAAFVDDDSVERGVVVVRGSEAQGVYQFATSQVELGDLSPGQHTVVVGLADVGDTLSAVPLAQVTFTVDEAEATLCGKLDDLATVVGALEGIGPDTTVEQVREARDNLRDAVDDVRDAASDAEKARLDTLEDANNDLKDAVDDLPEGATLAEAQSAISEKVAAVALAREQALSDLDCG